MSNSAGVCFRGRATRPPARNHTALVQPRESSEVALGTPAASELGCGGLGCGGLAAAPRRGGTAGPRRDGPAVARAKPVAVEPECDGEVPRGGGRVPFRTVTHLCWSADVPHTARRPQNLRGDAALRAPVLGRRTVTRWAPSRADVRLVRPALAYGLVACCPGSPRASTGRRPCRRLLGERRTHAARPRRSRRGAIRRTGRPRAGRGVDPGCVRARCVLSTLGARSWRSAAVGQAARRAQNPHGDAAMYAPDPPRARVFEARFSAPGEHSGSAGSPRPT